MMRQSFAHHIKDLRDRWHPLFHLRRSRVFRSLLQHVDFPVWVRLYGIPHPVNIHLAKHASLLFSPRTSEPEIVALFAAIQEVHAPQVFWDIGAYVGYYGFLLKGINSSIEVLMFEPDTTNRSVIERTCTRFGLTDISVVAAAVSDYDGEKTFFSDPLTGASGTLENPSDSFLVQNYGISPSSIRVRTVTVDGIRRSSRRVDLIKIDVEGHEAKVIAGAGQTLLQDQPLLVFECFDHDRALLDSLAGMGYHLYDAERMSTDLDLATNYLAVPPRFAATTGLLFEKWHEKITLLWKS